MTSPHFLIFLAVCAVVLGVPFAVGRTLHRRNLAQARDRAFAGIRPERPLNIIRGDGEGA